MRLEGDHKWTLFEVPHEGDSWVARLRGFTTMWGYLLTMATFVNSFFLSQTYARMVPQGGTLGTARARLLRTL